MSDRASLLFEIGMEECPARFVGPALADLRHLIKKALTGHRLGFKDVQTFGTPRRLAVLVSELQDRQADNETEVKGPPAKAAFDPSGVHTKAATGFASSQGVSVEDLVVKETSAGSYVYAIKKESGRRVQEVLPEILKSAILDLRFPKSMRWGDGSLRFARPIRWLVALYGTEVVSFNIENLIAGRSTMGHRTLANEPIELSSADDYVTELKTKGQVLVDIGERRAEIHRQIHETAATVQGEVRDDDALLDEVLHLVEWPTALAGRFDPDYLSVPKEILTTTMIEHQKYFPVYGADGSLLPMFITVRNGGSESLDVVRAGNEKVLSARLQDARFFYEEDQKTPLIDRVEGLKSVLFQEQLGSVWDKVERVRQLALTMSADFEAEHQKNVARAAMLAKADLLTQVVYELPELQGLMGREYALLSGESAEVAQAIWEHYLPRHAGDALPESTIGSVLSVADKLDTIAGCFGIGLIPTGSTDPYALRRQAVGVIRIALAGRLSLSLKDMIQEAVAQYGTMIQDPAGTVDAVLQFFTVRLKNLLTERGYAVELVDAGIALGIDDLKQAKERVKALAEATGSAPFADALATFHRVANLATKHSGEAVDADLFEDEAEKGLWDALQTARATIDPIVNARRYADAIPVLASLKPATDRFFDAVMVMADDPQVRANRLALLRDVVALFGQVADFSEVRP